MVCMVKIYRKCTKYSSFYTDIVLPLNLPDGGLNMEADEIKKGATGRLKISDDVIISVSKLAAMDVKGVARLNGETGMMSKLRGNGPIKVRLMGDVAAIDISIVVKSSEKAAAVAEDVQEAVKENVQNMTGVTVARVNVTVGGVAFD